MRLRLAVLGALLLLGATTAQAQEKKRFRIGPQVGTFLPSNQQARDQFGNSWANVGLGFGDVEPVKNEGELIFDINFISSRSNNSEVFLAPLGLVFRRGTDTERSVKPYFGGSVNYLVTNFRTPTIASGFRTGYGASAFAGVVFKKSAYVEARYYGFNKVRGFDFSGLNLALGWRF